MDEARCAARMSVVVGLGLERTPTSIDRHGALVWTGWRLFRFGAPGLSYNAEITQHHTATKRRPTQKSKRPPSAEPDPAQTLCRLHPLDKYR